MLYESPNITDLTSGDELNSLVSSWSSKLAGVDRWILQDHVILHLCFSGFVDAHIEIDLPPGFIYEHSVPKGFRWFLSRTYGNKAAALLHDALYRSGLVPKDVADAVYDWLTTSTDQSRGFVTNVASKLVKKFGQPPVLPTVLLGAALSAPSVNPDFKGRSTLHHITLYFRTESTHA